MTKEAKKITLWDGYEVELNDDLLNDFDFMLDFDDARRENDLRLLMQCTFGLIGGDDVYNKVREHIIAEKGRFETNELMKIVEKVTSALPKAGQGA